MKHKFYINNFPNDDTTRVLMLYGGVEINHTVDSTTLMIYVLLCEINVKKNCLIEDKFIISTIPLNSLYKAKLGTIWKGQNYTYQSFNFSNNTNNLNLKFKMLRDKPKAITLEKLISNNKSQIKLPKKQSINDIFKKNPHLHKFLSKTYYCDIKSVNGIRVLISSIVIFQSLFPNNNTIKKDILTHSPQMIINKYFHLSTDYSGECIYKVKKNHEKTGKQTLNFLESIVENRKIQKVVSLLQMSLEDIDFSTEIKYSKIRYPVIMPPFLDDLHLEVRGIWLKKNECFLITNIDKHSSIDHYVYSKKILITFHKFN